MEKTGKSVHTKTTFYQEMAEKWFVEANVAYNQI